MKPHHAHWPLRVPHQFTPAHTTLWDNLSISARRFPHKTALDFLGSQTSYRELAQQAEQLAAWLANAGVKKGDRVLLYMQNCPQWVVAHFGILRANAVVVPVNPMNRAKELEHYITDAQARVAITTSDLAAHMAAASDALPANNRLAHMWVSDYTDAFDPSAQAIEQWPLAWQDWLVAKHPAVQISGGQVHPWPDAFRHAHTTPPEYLMQPDDLAVLPYTSGTTGLPKGCMHPHRSIMHNAMAAAMWHNATQENIALCVVPMFHITGMVAVMHTSVYVGATIVLMPRWDRDYAGRLISQRRVTHWTNIPTMVIDLLGSPTFDQYDLGSLVAIGGGGAAMPQAVAQRLWELYGLRYVEGYGLTETAAPSHSNPPDRPKQQCLGIPFIGVDARVIHPETLQEVAPGEQGEIIMSRGLDVSPSRHPRSLCGGSARQLSRRNRQSLCGAAPKPPRTGQRRRHIGLVSRQHGGVQSPAPGAIHGRLAQERQWQSHVAKFARGRNGQKRIKPCQFRMGFPLTTHSSICWDSNSLLAE